MCFRKGTSFFWLLLDRYIACIGNEHWISKIKKDAKTCVFGKMSLSLHPNSEMALSSSG